VIFGEYQQQTDEKGRIRIPAKLKPFFAEVVTITKGTNGCLFVFANTEFSENLGEKLVKIPLSNDKAQHGVRAFFSSASTLEEDNQGRCLLPRNLREFAAIKKDIVFIGVGNHAEIWAKENYDNYMAGKPTISTADFDKLFAALAEYGV
jgi:MraZ protein